MVHCVIQEYHLGEGYDPVKLCLDQLLAVSKKKIKKSLGGTGSDNAAYGSVSVWWNSRDGMKFHVIEYPCHRYVSSIYSPRVMYNRFTHRPTLPDRARVKYFNWLMSDNSPWRRFSNRLISEVPDGYDGSVQDFIYEHGWVWTDFSSPSNLQHSFLTAARMAAEWPRLIKKWAHWVDSGVDPAVAFVFQDVFHIQKHRDKDNHQLWKVNHSNLYDWPVDICTSSEEALKNFSTGTLDQKILNKPFSESPNYTPVNAIWGDNGAKTPSKDYYPNVLFRLYNKDTGENHRLGLSKEDCKQTWQGQLGFSKFDYGKFWMVREPEILEIMKLETERLCINTDSNSKGSVLLTAI